MSLVSSRMFPILAHNLPFSHATNHAPNLSDSPITVLPLDLSLLPCNLSSPTSPLALFALSSSSLFFFFFPRVLTLIFCLHICSYLFWCLLKTPSHLSYAMKLLVWPTTIDIFPLPCPLPSPPFPNSLVFQVSCFIFSSSHAVGILLTDWDVHLTGLHSSTEFHRRLKDSRESFVWPCSALRIEETQ